MDLKMINNTDKYGFCKLHYAQFWEEDVDKSLQLKLDGANYTTALYQYLSKSSNIRKEILKIYNRYIDFNMKELIHHRYLQYFDETFSYTYNVNNDDIIEYIKTYQFNTNLLIKMFESGNYKIDDQLLETLNTYVNNIYKEFKEEYSEIIDEDQEDSLELFSYLEKRIKDYNTPITYHEIDGIDENEREEKLNKVILAKKNINEFNTFEIKIKKFLS